MSTAAGLLAPRSSPARRARDDVAAAVDADAFRPDPAIALHHQIKEDMVLHLRSGRWPPGFELPTEASLCAHYGVSRGTLRRAIADLVTDGYIERHRGRGSFVSRPKLESGVAGSYSRFRVIGPPLDPGGRVLACRRDARREGRRDDAAASNRAARSGASSGSATRTACRSACRRASSRSRSAPTSRARTSRARHLVDVMREAYDLQLASAVEYVDPTVADGYAARHLGIPLRTPLFQIERITSAVNEEVAEYRRALLRGDTYRYRIELR